MQELCTSHVLAFILGIELCDYVVDGWDLQEPAISQLFDTNSSFKVK